jgi:Endonuclease-reverse transcriptase
MQNITGPAPKRLRIYQQNLNKSDKAQYDLLNSPIHKEWDLLLLQEPYIDTLGNTKANHYWRVIYPTSHLDDGSAKRSIILVNAGLDTDTWSQVSFTGSNDVTVIRIGHPQGRLTIFNIYNDCGHSETLRTLDHYITKERHNIIQHETDAMIWCGDFNRHHAMWDEERNQHLFTAPATREAEELISLIADYNMVMTLPKRLPTLQSMSTKNWTRVDNVFCTDNIAETVITCDTRPSMRGPGTDHVPILTILNIEATHNPTAPFHNYRMVDWKEFREHLAKRLEDIPEPKEIETEKEYNEAVNALTTAIQDTIEDAIPLSKPVPHSRRWWNRDLSSLKKEKNRINNQSYLHRAITDHPSHQEHSRISAKYEEAIKKAKAQHWADYLEDLSDGMLWSANKYLTNTVTDGGKSRIPTLKYISADGTEQIAETNEDKSTTLATAFFPPKPAESQVPPSDTLKG